MHLKTKKIFLVVLLLASFQRGFSQLEILPMKEGPKTKRPSQSSVGPQGGTASGQANASAEKKDSLGFQRRDDRKDSVAVSFRYLDSTRRYNLDSSVNDFDNYFSVPSTYQYLGNNGLAAFPLIFRPNMNPGWDAGFHAFDIYRYSLQASKLYRNNRPFSMITYQLASGKEQMLSVMHNQQPRPNFGFGGEYRLINAPGLFVNQNTNHNNYRLFATYTGKRKRYSANVIFAGNAIKASENGGITNDSLLLDPNKKKRFSIPVNLGSGIFNPNPFTSAVKTGNNYNDISILVRQSYDLGKRDSIMINDSTKEYLFFPRLRFRHSLTYSEYKFNYTDEFADSTIYSNWYDVGFDSPDDTFDLTEKWKILRNDFSLLQFPDAKNTSHFILAGISHETIRSPGKENFSNLFLHGEYHLPSRNKKWDLEFSGEYYLSGLNGGDYAARANISRLLSRKLGYVRLFFSNANRTPSFIYDSRSTFHLGDTINLNKENNISFGASAEGPRHSLGLRNHLLTNYTYFTSHYQFEQFNKVINVLQIFGSWKLKLGRRWNWYMDATMQQTGSGSPVRVPLLYTRNRLAFEGLFFRNLNISTGLEARYYTPYKAMDYSPVLGQFFVQDSMTIKNLPDVAAFVHFRIRGFTGYIRAENLNTVDFSNGLGFINNNFAAPHYPTQGLMVRFGIKWFFVN